jgi:hypothetical protein
VQKTEFFLFHGLFVWSFKTRVEYGFLYNPPIEEAVNSMEQIQIHVQEFHPGVLDKDPNSAQNLGSDPDYNYTYTCRILTHKNLPNVMDLLHFIEIFLARRSNQVPSR